MTDQESAEAIVRQNNPTFTIQEWENGEWTNRVVSPDESPDEYEAMIADRVPITAVGKDRIVAGEVNLTLRRQFVTGMRKLRSNLQTLESTHPTGPNWSGMTAVQRQEATRVGLADVTQGILWLGNVLRDSGIFRPDDEDADLI